MGRGRFSGTVCMERGETRGTGCEVSISELRMWNEGNQKTGVVALSSERRTKDEGNQEAEPRGEAVPSCLTAPSNCHARAVHALALARILAPSGSSRRPHPRSVRILAPSASPRHTSPKRKSPLSAHKRSKRSTKPPIWHPFPLNPQPSLLFPQPFPLSPSPFSLVQRIRR